MGFMCFFSIVIALAKVRLRNILLAYKEIRKRACLGTFYRRELCLIQKFTISEHARLQTFIFNKLVTNNDASSWGEIFICWQFLMRFSFQLFSVSIQDIPDVDGDKVFGIRTFSVRMGKKKVSLEVSLVSASKKWASVTKQSSDDKYLCLFQFRIWVF